MNKTFIGSCCIVLVAIMAYFFWSREVTRSVKDEALIVGTNAEYPPFSFMQDDQIVGFDIDVAREVTQRLGKRMILKDMPFDALLPKLQLGDVHLLAAGMTATPERALRVNFTKPYLSNDPFLIITRASQLPLVTVNELAGKKVAVNEGFTADAYLSAFPAIDLRRLSSTSEALLALESGRVDAFVSAQSSVQSFFDLHSRDEYHIHTIDGTSDTYALALSKKYPNLLHEVQHALDAMENDGTLDRLRKKWRVA